MRRPFTVGRLSGPWKNNFGLGPARARAFLLALLTWAAHVGHAQGGAEPRSLITLHVYNYAHVAPPELVRAEQVAAGIFRKAGIGTAWIDCPLSPTASDRYPACQAPLTPSHFIVHITSMPLAERPASYRGDMGSALPCHKDQAACSVYVFYQVVSAWAKQGEASSYQLLGHALAHEVGHLLLGPDSHSRPGVMKADWSIKDFAAMARRSLRFTPVQSAHLQSEVASRAREHRGVLAVPGF